MMSSLHLQQLPRAGPSWSRSPSAPCPWRTRQTWKSGVQTEAQGTAHDNIQHSEGWGLPPQGRDVSRVSSKQQIDHRLHLEAAAGRHSRAARKQEAPESEGFFLSFTCKNVSLHITMRRFRLTTIRRGGTEAEDSPAGLLPPDEDPAS